MQMIQLKAAYYNYTSVQKHLNTNLYIYKVYTIYRVKFMHLFKVMEATDFCLKN